MSRKHERQLNPPRGEFYVPAHAPKAGDVNSVRARHDVVRAINRSKIRKALKKLIDQRLSETVGQRASAAMVLPIVDAWAKEWRLTQWMLRDGMLWFKWGGVARDFWNERFDEQRLNGLELNAEDIGSYLDGTQFVNLWSGDFVLDVTGCDLTVTSWAAWTKRVRCAVKRRLAEIKAAADLRASQTGLIRVSRDGRPAKSKAQKVRGYYDWFVSFQLCNERYEQIASRHDVPVQTVKDGVKSVASAARVDLRREKGGRPKGSATSKIMKRNYRAAPHK